MAGFFVAFEGIDGAGKYTQLREARQWLEHLGYAVRWSSEPNDQSSPIGRLIRAMLRGDMSRTEDPVEFQRLYVIDRAQDIFCAIQPALASGMVYLIERYALSTIAYGMLSGAPTDVFFDLHRQVVGPAMRWPDLTILLDLPVEEAIQRKTAAGAMPQLFEKAAFLERVRQNYLTLTTAPLFRDRIAVINGSGDIATVAERVSKAIEPRLPSRT